MFDPSKLNLDDQSTETSNQDTPVTKPDTQKKENVKGDILGELGGTDATKGASVDKKNDTERSIDKNTYSPKANAKKDIEEPEQQKQQKTVIKEEKPTFVFDVNIKSIQDVVQYINNNEYDFVTFEPDLEKVTVTFRKDQVIAEKKYIPYPKYSEILLKAKEITKLKLSITGVEQEGKSQIIMENKNYDVLAKTVPSKNGEKLFFKTVLSTNQEKAKKQQKKSNLAQMLGFLGAILIILLIIGSGFLSFIVLNANTIEDVRFFQSLGIDLSDINKFIQNIVTVLFSGLIFFEVIALAFSLFRFLLTKKIFKRKKIKYAILSAILFILTFSTASGWLFIDKKIRELPDWARVAKGEIQFYDNAKLISDNFDINGSYITDTSAMIGPVDIKFDLTNLEKNERKKGFVIRKYIWDFNGEEVITTEPTLIQTFDKKGITNIKLQIEEVDAAGAITEKDIDNLPIVNVQYMVDIKYTPVDSGGSYVTLDAGDLSVLGEAQWYDLANLDVPIYTGSKYTTPRPISKETLFGLYMKNASRSENVLDKILIIKGEKEKKLNANIEAEILPGNDLQYTFFASNILVDNGAGDIDVFEWEIDGKVIPKKADYLDLKKSSTVKHTFKEYGTHTIRLTLTDLAGNTKSITKEITINKSLKIGKKFLIFSDKTQLQDKKDYRYNKALNEYFIDELAVPTELRFDARLVRAQNPKFSLKDIEWDYDNDGNTDAKGKVANLKILSEGSQIIKLKYIFQNKRMPTEIVELEETIYIESIKKEAIIDFVLLKSSEYIPTKVKFDASKSSVQGKNIAKFIWDFGDGTAPMSGDSIIDGHYYTKEGDYDVGLVIVTEDGSRYTVSKKLILKPAPQEAKIKVSMKRAPAYQEIDFISSGSTGDIIGYFWDFGDGETSSKANPSHFYKKPGTYDVKLRLDYRNNNFKETIQKIEIQ